MSNLPVIFVLAPIAIYLLVAMRKRAVAITEEEFFESRGLISTEEFANSSVAYGFQIASVSVFFAFGYHYGLGGIVNPFFWGVGILLFALFVPHIADFFGTTQTLHGFLGTRYKSKAITVIASIMTTFGFLGAFTAELAWGSYVLAIINDDPVFIGISMAAMAAIVTFYVTRSGHLSVIQTDQYQVVFAHSAFVILVVFLITLLHAQEGNAKAIGFFLSTATGLVLAGVSYSVFRQIKSHDPSVTENLGLRVSYVILGVMVAGLTACVINALVFMNSGLSFNNLASEKHLYDFNQGNLNLLSLALLPICWQFVDVTMWQRLGATRLPSGENETRFSSIRQALKRYMVESPASWILALAAGVALRYADIGVTGDTVWNGLAEIPVSILTAETGMAPWIQYLVASVFVAGIVAAMLSTADSFLIASTFTLVQDLAPASGVSGTGFGSDRLRLGRMAAVVFVVVGVASYLLATAYDVDILTVLFGAFSAQVSLFPAVFGTIVLNDRAASSFSTLLSIIAGFAAGLYALLIALNDPNWALYPPLFSLGASVLVYFAGWFFGDDDAGTGASSSQVRARKHFKMISVFLVVLLLAHPAAYGYESLYGPIPDGNGNPMSFWLRWEILSIGGTMVVTLFFWKTIIWGSPGSNALEDEPVLEGAKSHRVASALIALLFFLVGFGAAGVMAYFKCALWMQVLSLLVGVGATVFLESISLYGISDRLATEHENLRNGVQDKVVEKISRIVQVKVGIRDNILKYLCYSDIPIACAFLVLFLFVLIETAIGPTDNFELRAFVSGAVALQLLYSNIVFWIELLPETNRGSGIIDRWLSEPLRPVREMLRPEEDLTLNKVEWAKAELKKMFGPIT